jgi:hypothetical protein
MARWFIVVAVTAVVGLPLASTETAAAARSCGLTSRVDGIRYDVREVRGTVSCRTVKRVVTKFLRSGTVSSPWTCFRGHNSSPYAASCARGKHVLVRVYAPN